MTTFEAAVPAATSVPAVPAPRRGVARFVGLESDYWRLLIRGSALLGITLGIYRFWLTTDMRRFLWSNTEVAGETLEYTGTARELLIGFLIAVAILIPVYTLLFIIALNLGTFGAIAGPIGFLLLTLLGHFAVYRARRYRLTRTVYRGVRFQQTGSAIRYAVMAILWWTLIILTLGLAYPAAQASLERYKMKHTYLGNLPGRFEGTAGRLFLRGLLMWIVTIGPLLASLAAIIATFDPTAIEALVSGGAGEEALRRLFTDNAGLTAAFGLSVFALVWSFFAALLLYPVFQAMLLRWWIGGLRFGDVEATSRLRVGQVYGTYLRFIGWSWVLGMAGGVFAGMCIALIALIVGSTTSNIGEIAGAVIGVGTYVVIALGYSALYQVKLRLGLWRIMVETLDLTNIVALENVSSVGAPSSPVGEGLADALNVGGF